MRIRARLAFAVPLLAAVMPASAVTVRGLYQATVPVPNQSAQEREPALRQALEAVLVRVIGNRNLPPETAPVLDRAASLVQGYGYESASAGPGLLLRAQFDARAVEAALRSHNLPVWGDNRLSQLVWIALRDDSGTRGLLDAGAAAARAPALLATAEARGLPFTFPSLDATDRQLATFNEVWSGNFDGVQAAARRYNTDLIVVGRVGREAGRWLGRWTLLSRSGASEEWSSVHATLDAALAAGVHELADRQAQRYATQTGSVQELRLQVGGVQSLRDYGRALNYLRNLNAVRSAQVDTVQQDTLVFRLKVEGDPETLARVITAGNVLRRQEDDLFGSAGRYVLVR